MRYSVAILAALLLSASALKSVDAAIYAPDAFISGDFALGPTSPGKWGPPTMGTGATVTWSLMGSGFALAGEPGGHGGMPSLALSSFMPLGFKTAIESAFAAWSAVADITFVEVADPVVDWLAAGASASDIRITGAKFDGAGSTLAHGYYPPANGGPAAGDIHFDYDETWVLGFPGSGFDIFQVAAHEIGHAIGLDHTGVSASLMNPFYTEAFSGPQADDIAGAVHIYGAPVSEVPEPTTFVIWSLAGGLGLVLRARRRRNPA
ncbi:MAG: matrixin family metalloprotease [Betaproteobacteria bacterium]